MNKPTVIKLLVVIVLGACIAGYFAIRRDMEKFHKFEQPARNIDSYTRGFYARHERWPVSWLELESDLSDTSRAWANSWLQKIVGSINFESKRQPNECKITVRSNRFKSSYTLTSRCDNLKRCKEFEAMFLSLSL